MTGETREAVERLDADVPVAYEPDSADDGRYGPPINRAAQAYAAQAVKQKDHIVAGLLAVFLGLFGLHKFYLGYNETAFIMLAVSIIGSIVSFGLAAAVVWVLAGMCQSYSFFISANAAALSDLLRFKKSTSYWDR